MIIASGLPMVSARTSFEAARKRSGEAGGHADSSAMTALSESAPSKQFAERSKSKPTAHPFARRATQATLRGYRWKRSYRIRVLLVDTIAVVMAVVLASMGRFGLPDDIVAKWPTVAIYSVPLAVIWLTALGMQHSRDLTLVGVGAQEYRLVLMATFSVFGIIAAAGLIAKLQIARGYLLIALPVGLAGLVIGRHLLRRHFARKRARGGFMNHVVALGTQDVTVKNRMIDKPISLHGVVERPLDDIVDKITGNPIGAKRPLELRVKRWIDVMITAAVLTLVTPLLATLALILLIDSPGPVFYRRRVLGRGGRTFDALKLRTMFCDGDAMLATRPDLQQRLEADHKLDEDPRITRCGRWLRRLSLDELPQLWNVLRGEMSLVGPRMISPPELERYGAHGKTLLTVQPGLTGLWQVSGRSNLPPLERVRLDLEYVEKRSLALDLQLLLRTIPAVLCCRGAH